MQRFKAIDLFCGAGGLSKGLFNSGYDIKLAVDVDESVLNTYRSNFSYCQVLQENIKNISGKEISNLTNIKKGDNFLLAGCPPCQGFSNIGKRNIADEKNELVYDYVRIVHELMPSFILMENVPGMSSGIGKHIFNNVVTLLESNYHLEYAILNAADYGVPQIRRRLVLHGIRNDVNDVLTQLYDVHKLDLLPIPTHSNDKNSALLPWVTVGESIMDLPSINAGEKYETEKIHNHVCRNLSDVNIMRLKEIHKHGGSRTCLPNSLVLECHKKRNVSYTDTYGVMSLNKPAPTMTAGCTVYSKGRFGHPTQDRAISIREAARLQSFPDDFVFTGGIDSMSLQIGNAVPPNLAAASASKIYGFMIDYQKFLDQQHL